MLSKCKVVFAIFNTFYVLFLILLPTVKTGGMEKEGRGRGGGVEGGGGGGGRGKQLGQASTRIY